MESEINAESLRDAYNYAKGNWEYQVVFAVMCAVFVVGLVRMVLERLRIKNIKRLAETSGLLYEDRPQVGFGLRGLGPELLRRGEYCTATHGLKDISALPGAWYLDFQYTAYLNGNRKRSCERNFGLALFCSGELSMPSFELAPETAFGRARDLLAKRDIDLPDRPAFSRRYALTGPDRERVSAAFSPGVTAVFERLRGDWQVQAEGGCLIAFKKGRVSAGNYPAFIEEARTIFRAFIADPRNKGASNNAAAAADPAGDAAVEGEFARLTGDGALFGGNKAAEAALLAVGVGFMIAIVYALLRN